jgi:hypothetical protein
VVAAAIAIAKSVSTISAVVKFPQTPVSQEHLGEDRNGEARPVNDSSFRILRGTAMHVTAVAEMTAIDIEFADQLIRVGVGNANAEMFRHTGTDGGRGHRRAPIRRKSGPSYSNVNRRGVVDMSLTAALMWHVGGLAR